MAEKFINNCKDAHRAFWNFVRHVFTEHRPEVIVIAILATLTVIYFAVRAPASNGTAPDWVWAQQISGTGEEKSLAVTTDSDGNSYVTGYFTGAITVGGIGGTTLDATGNRKDIFVAKFKPDGSVFPGFVPFSIGGTTDDSGNGIAIDPVSTPPSIYITGRFGGSVNFNPGVGGNLTSDGSVDAFVAKYDSTGVYQWAHQFGFNGAVDLDQGNAIAVDSDNYVYVTGSYTNGGMLNGDLIPTTLGTGADIFVLKYDSGGVYQWAKTAGGTTDDSGLGIAVKSPNDVYVSGYFSGTATFVSGSLSPSVIVSSLGVSDAFAAKYNTNGAILWAKPMGGNEDPAFTDKARGIAVDPSGANVFVTGVFSGDAGITYPNLNNWVAINGTGPSDLNVVNGGLDVQTLIMDGNGNIFAGTSKSGIFKSINNGVTWDNVGNMATGLLTSQSLDVRSLVIDSSSGNIFAGTADGVFKSTDSSGTAWTAVNGGVPFDLNIGNGGLNVQTLVTDGVNIFAGTSSGGVFKSIDNGTNWVAFNSAGLTSLNVQTLVINGSDIYAGTAIGGVFSSPISSATWTTKNGFGPDITNLNIKALIIDGSGNIYAGTAAGVFKSSTSGTSWDKIDGTNNFNTRSIIIIGLNIFVGTNSGGVFESTDGGADWVAVNTGLSDLDVRSLITDGVANIFAGTLGGGVFLSNNSSNPTPFSTPNLNLSALSAGDVFVAKLDPSNGNPDWAVKMSKDAVEVPALTLDRDNNVYVAGDFKGSSVEFNYATPGDTLDSGSGGTISDAFIAKLTPTGVLDWLKQAGLSTDTGNAFAHGISAVGVDNLRVAGSFGPSTGESVNFDSINLSSLGLSDAFLAKLAILPTIEFDPISSSIGEGGSTANLQVNLSTTSIETVTADCTVSAGTATNVTDYTITLSPCVTIAPGSTTGTVNVNIIDDSIVEGNESVIITLVNPANAALGVNTSYTLTITDNDTSGGGGSNICSTPAGTCGNPGDSSVAPSVNLCTNGSPSSVSLSGNNWTWTCDSCGGSPTCTSVKTVTPPDPNISTPGVCGTPVAPPTSNLCTSGTPSSVSGTGPWTWLCNGSDSNSSTDDVPCSLTPINGACKEPAVRIAVSAPLPADLCALGTPSIISWNSPWIWNCLGSNGGSNSSTICSASQPEPFCGTSDGKILETAPTTDLCTSGTAFPSPVSENDTGWDWLCYIPSSDPFLSKSCSVTKPTLTACAQSCGDPNCLPTDPAELAACSPIENPPFEASACVDGDPLPCPQNPPDEPQLTGEVVIPGDETPPVPPPAPTDGVNGDPSLTPDGVGTTDTPTGVIAGIMDSILPQSVLDIFGNLLNPFTSPIGNAAANVLAIVGMVAGAAVTVASALFLDISSLSELSLLPAKISNLLLVALGFKQKKWGIAFDAENQGPLDPVSLTLKDNLGRVIKTSITDLEGRYGFAVEPGTYTISAEKMNYRFPSVKLWEKAKTTLYDNLYFGKDIVIEKSGQVIDYNIPLDRVEQNWNEVEKNRLGIATSYKTKKIIKKISNILFYAGFAVATIALIATPSTFNIVIFSLYILLSILFQTRVFKAREKGKVVKDGIPLADAVLKISSAAIPDMLIKRVVTDQTGEYYCLLGKGKYIVNIEAKTGLDEYKKVFTSEPINATKGIINTKFEII